MKRTILILLCSPYLTIFSQCPPDINFGVNMGSVTPTATVQNIFCAWPNDYYSFSATSGDTYYFSSCNDVGAPTTVNISIFDAGFTHLSTNQGNGFDCAGTKGSLSFVAPSTGTFYVMFSRGGSCNTSGTQCIDIDYWASLSGSSGNSAPDCGDHIDVCTDLSFDIDASGVGLDELPALGGTSNPDYSISGNPWSGNQGCQMDGETYPTWLRINITTAGNLAFTFGGGGAQSGFYDWTLWQYSSTICTDISNDVAAPVRCNWNGVDNGGTGCENSIPVGGDATNYEPALAVNANEQYLILFNNYSAVTTTVPLDFTNSSATVSCSPLPIELFNFSAEQKENKVVLQWHTLTEINNHHFTIERSLDGESFKAIGSIDGAGNSTELLSYRFEDTQPANGDNYYRIVQHDYDGDFTSSDLVYLNYDQSPSFFTYVENGELHIHVDRPTDDSKINVYNSVGKLELTLQLMKGHNDFVVRELKQGQLYIVELIDLLHQNSLAKVFY